MPKSFKIITLGCKVNQYESAYVSEALSEAGWHRTIGNEKADVSIVNTCIVTRTASRQSRQEIRKAIRENPEGTVAATGCYAQAFSDELSEIKGLRLIVGNTEKGRLPEILLNFKESSQPNIDCKAFEREAPFDFLPIKHFPDRARAFLKIQDGCESFCSYCIVPVARGPLRSLPPTQVLSTLQSFAKEGYREIVLTGIHLGKYGAGLDKGMNLNHLLKAIGKEGLPIRIRMSSLEINEIDSKLIEMMASEDWLCRHFHIPLQSGDDHILRRMKRHYTAVEFSRLVERIHKKVPLAAIGVDVMSGFPGEDLAAHQNTRAVIDDLPVSYVHAFPFSARPGTPAATMTDQVHAEVTKKRAAEIRDLGQKKRLAFYQRCIGEEFMVLPEGWHSEKEGIMKGKTDNYLDVIFPSSEKLNQPVPVLMKKVQEKRLMGVT